MQSNIYMQHFWTRNSTLRALQEMSDNNDDNIFISKENGQKSHNFALSLSQYST